MHLTQERKSAIRYFLLFLLMSMVGYWVPYQWLAIVPRNIDHLAGVLLSPLAHENVDHIFYNLIYIIPFGLSICLLERKPLYPMVALYLISGILVWIFGKDGFHIGMSGFAISCTVYLIFSGILDLSRIYIIVGIITFLTQQVILSGIFMPQDGISDDSHIAGALAGLLVSVTFHYITGPKK